MNAMLDPRIVATSTQRRLDALEGRWVELDDEDVLSDGRLTTLPNSSDRRRAVRALQGIDTTAKGKSRRLRPFKHLLRRSLASRPAHSLFEPFERLASAADARERSSVNRRTSWKAPRFQYRRGMRPTCV